MKQSALGSVGQGHAPPK